MDEYLTKATHDAEACAADLQDALRQADAVTALILLPLIGEARALALRIEELRGAIEARGGRP